MRHTVRRSISLLALAAALACTGLTVGAQSAPRLYDPEPPTDSAYVRVILATNEGPIDVVVDGRVRVHHLKAGYASDYMVIPNGQHRVALHFLGKPTAQVTAAIEVIRGRSMSLAFTTLKSDTTPSIFEDKANSNKLKAALTAYHLDPAAGPVDILTMDRGTKVFSNLTFGMSASKQVNPIFVELLATPIEVKAPETRASVAMSAGGAFSLLLLPGKDGKSRLQVIQNQIERYTGP
jgi:alginate O-acetyltransferase complex protein AlgF